MKVAIAVRVRNSEGKTLVVLSDALQSWVMPGGKLEQYEGWEKAASRELYEETGLHCQSFVQLGWVDYFTGDDQFLVLFVEAIGWTGEATLREPDKHLDLAWVDLDKRGHGLHPFFRTLTQWLDSRRTA